MRDGGGGRGHGQRDAGADGQLMVGRDLADFTATLPETGASPSSKARLEGAWGAGREFEVRRGEIMGLLGWWAPGARSLEAAGRPALCGTGELRAMASAAQGARAMLRAGLTMSRDRRARADVHFSLRPTCAEGGALCQAWLDPASRAGCASRCPGRSSASAQGRSMCVRRRVGRQPAKLARAKQLCPAPAWWCSTSPARVEGAPSAAYPRCSAAEQGWRSRDFVELRS